MIEWKYFDRFEPITNKYLPKRGEGDSMATQIVTAVSKLIYKWYNDGDVYDNTHGMLGWCNDLSSFANWLYMYAGGQQKTLEKIYEAKTDDDYEEILKELADNLLNDTLKPFETMKKSGSIYDCDGPFRFEEGPIEDAEEISWE